MKRFFLAIPALGALAACALPPLGTSQADIQAYDDAVASIGCTLGTEADYLPVEFQTGLSRDQLLAIGKYKLAAEQAVSLENGGIKLTTGACA